MENVIQNHVSLIKKFPDPQTFREQEWSTRFQHDNVIIHSHENDFYYPTHWGLLSVKCAFGGSEFYLKERCKYSVSAGNFLVLNEGTHYSSYIQSHAVVESLAILFSSQYKSNVSRVFLETADKLTDDPFEAPCQDMYLEEKLFAYNVTISGFIHAIRALTKNFPGNERSISELLFFLLEALILNNCSAIKEINEIDAVRHSTRKEIFRRLNNVKDYIDSCFNENITLDELSKIALMSPFHLLRQFKKNFKITPHQYIMKQRLDQSRQMILCSESSLADICLTIGFKDVCSYSKLFKRSYGLSPMQFRAAHKAC